MLIEPTFDVVVAGRRQAAPDVVELTLRDAAGGSLPPWSPGAHIDVVLGDRLVRQYSLVADPDDRDEWRIAVLREPDGRGGSTRIHALANEGATLRVRGPRNHFSLEDAPRLRFIAGGIGIAPILPMVDAAERAGRDWSLLYLGRSRDRMAYLDRLAPYVEHVTVHPTGELGSVEVRDVVGAPDDDTLVYACGPGRLLDALEAAARAWPAGALRVERFTGVTADTSGDEAFTVEFVLSGVRAEVPPDRSILAVAAELGLPVSFNCTEGTCGTCETGVVEGRIEHRDVLLTPKERAANTTMMICCSRAERGCPLLVLEM